MNNSNISDLPIIEDEVTFYTHKKKGRKFIYEIKLISKKINGYKTFALLRRWYFDKDNIPQFAIGEFSPMNKLAYERKIIQKEKIMKYKRQ